MGRVRCVPDLGDQVGELLGGHVDVRWEAPVNCCGVAGGDAAGTELGSYFVERIAVNTGTVSVLPGFRAASVEDWAGHIVGRTGRDGAEPP
jgi:hypothetical protein